MKDYLAFNDEDLAAFIKQHKGTIHTREFPTRCGTCRFISRFEAAEKVIERMEFTLKLAKLPVYQNWKKIKEKI